MGLLNRLDTANKHLQDQRALVIGGSGGVGRAISYQLADLGASVTVHGGSDAQRLERVVGYIRSHGGRARGILRYLERATDILPDLDAVGRVDILVVALGPVLYAGLAETEPEEWERLCSLNTALPGLLVSWALPGMRERDWGRIVLFGGPFGDSVRGFRTIGAYASAKAGLHSMCKSAAYEVSGHNVSINVISPGHIDEQRVAESSQAGNAKGHVSVERIARVAVDLVRSPEPDISGACITVDRGMA